MYGTLVAPGDLAGQVAQVYRNVAKSLAAAGATFADVVRVTWYATPPAALIGVEILAALHLSTAGGAPLDRRRRVRPGLTAGKRRA
jgi:enamine deaminase RidA (YjgF/YER057c/UK114 family)